MKISVFTPSHDTRWLGDAYRSLLVQDYDDWEWVILLNGKRQLPVDPEIARDRRVRLVNGPDHPNIGLLKLNACNYCQGDAFLELDHDDLLVPRTLGKVVRAIEEGAGFVYSDVAVFDDETKRPWGYPERTGWDKYWLRVYGKPFIATRCFELTPRSLCEVYYAPDHVRCWTRETYYKAGAHDPDILVGDDHDLMCRTYLTGTRFTKIDGCGYLYRYRKDNTTHQRADKIKQQVTRNRRRYLRPLIRQWCARHNHPVMDLGDVLRKGWWQPDKGRWPADDNELGWVTGMEVLQFLPPHQQVPTMNFIYESLIPGGYASFVVPSENGRYASQDPRHLTRFNLNSFLYYCDRDFASRNPDITARFQPVEMCEELPADPKLRVLDMKVLHVDLCALKGQRQPGRQLI